MSDRLVSASQLRAWAQTPGPGGYVPVHPQTLLILAQRLDELRRERLRLLAVLARLDAYREHGAPMPDCDELMALLKRPAA